MDPAQGRLGRRLARRANVRASEPAAVVRRKPHTNEYRVRGATATDPVLATLVLSAPHFASEDMYR